MVGSDRRGTADGSCSTCAAANGVPESEAICDLTLYPVHVDSKAKYACLILGLDCDGASITTIEGLASGDRLDPVQQAFIEADAFQCGFCTSGQIMSIRALLNATPAPSDDQIERAVTGNLCRCGAYRHILDAGRRAAVLEAVQGEEHHVNLPR
jgi:xanthine dehydrogenase YagT iron-sulfur-binding subunit